MAVEPRRPHGLQQPADALPTLQRDQGSVFRGLPAASPACQRTSRNQGEGARRNGGCGRRGNLEVKPVSEIWVKTLREENFFGPLKRRKPYPLQEPAWRDDRDTPQYTKSGHPKGRPSWSVGDHVVLYVGGHERIAG